VTDTRVGVIITSGTRFARTPQTARYEEHERHEFEVRDTTTIRELIELIDRKSPPPHPGHSYLSLPDPHEALPAHATLRQLGVADGATLRRFSWMR